MGRTLPSAMMVFDAEQARWSKFRRALRREDQETFDGIFRDARRHISAMAYASSPVPMEAVLLSMLLDARKAVVMLERRVKALESPPSPPTVAGGGEGGVAEPRTPARGEDFQGTKALLAGGGEEGK